MVPHAPLAVTSRVRSTAVVIPVHAPPIFSSPLSCAIPQLSLALVQTRRSTLELMTIHRQFSAQESVAASARPQGPVFTLLLKRLASSDEELSEFYKNTIACKECILELGSFLFTAVSTEASLRPQVTTL